MGAVCVGAERCYEHYAWFNAICPPLPLLGGTTAPCMFAALFLHPLIARLVAFELSVINSWTWSVHIINYCTDSASPNLKLIHWMFRKSTEDSPNKYIPDTAWPQWKSCSCHDNSLIDGQAMGLVGKDFFNDIYSASKFMCATDHFSRMLARLQSVVDRMLVWGRVPPQDACMVCLQELKDVNLTNYMYLRFHARSF